jgi:hypothetical protein
VQKKEQDEARKAMGLRNRPESRSRGEAAKDQGFAQLRRPELPQCKRPSPPPSPCSSIASSKMKYEAASVMSSQHRSSSPLSMRFLRESLDQTRDTADYDEMASSVSCISSTFGGDISSNAAVPSESGAGGTSFYSIPSVGSAFVGLGRAKLASAMHGRRSGEPLRRPGEVAMAPQPPPTARAVPYGVEVESRASSSSGIGRGCPPAWLLRQREMAARSRGDQAE